MLTANRIRFAALAMGVMALLVALWASSGSRRDTQAATQAGSHRTVAARTVTIPVSGMICQVCAGTVKSALKTVDGVQDADISLEQRNAVIHYDARTVSLDQLTRAIEKAGYKPGAPADVSR